MKTKTDTLLTVMKVLSWLALVGLIVKITAILISYGVSIGNPTGAKNLYMGLNLYNLRQYDFRQYTGMVSLTVAILVVETYIAFLVIKVLSKIKMANPFTIEVSKKLEKISYMILFTWVISLIYNGHAAWLSKRITGLQENLISGEFLLLAGVVFVFSQIFKKGVEIQSEHELTI
jgi:hypothetical protein